MFKPTTHIKTAHDVPRKMNEGHWQVSPIGYIYIYNSRYTALVAVMLHMGPGPKSTQGPSGTQGPKSAQVDPSGPMAQNGSAYH